MTPQSLGYQYGMNGRLSLPASDARGAEAGDEAGAEAATAAGLGAAASISALAHAAARPRCSSVSGCMAQCRARKRPVPVGISFTRAAFFLCAVLSRCVAARLSATSTAGGLDF